MIWKVFAVVLAAIIATSWLLARSGRFESKLLRNGFVAAGACAGIFAFLLPFFDQPRFDSVAVNYGVGIPLAVLGLIGRVYAALYLRRMGTTTTLDEVTRVIDTGPYSIVRHPQYVTGILSVMGWFTIWGAIYCLWLTPLLTLIAMVQASIEEKYILAKEFGESYEEYKSRVGMFLPKFR